tara:strand:+ start:112 stop:513 length:402 start_codon:yes stop_codon:yes gene_type:complete
MINNCYKGISLETELDIDGFLEDLEKIQKQVDYACSRAINDAAFKLQKDTVERIENENTMRSKWHKPRNKLGVHVKKSNKRNLEATISVDAPFANDMEEGRVLKSSSSTGRRVVKGATKANAVFGAASDAGLF